MRPSLQLVLLAGLLVVGCKKPGFGEAGQLVVTRHAGVAKGPEGTSVVIVEKLGADDPVLAAANAALQGQFAHDAWVVHERARAWLSARKDLDGALKKLLDEPVAIVLGAPASLPTEGLLWQVGDETPKTLPNVLWVAVPPSESDGGALEQALAGAIGQLTMRLMLHRAWVQVPSWQHGSLPPHPWLLTDPMGALIHGYGLHLESLARRYSRSGKLSAAPSVEGTTPDNARIAAIATNRYAHTPPPPLDAMRTNDERTAYVKQWISSVPPLKGPLWRGAQMTGIPGVVAAVFNALADDPSVSLETPPNTFFAPFYGGKLPSDFNARSLHASAIAELKILQAVATRLGEKNGALHPGINAVVEAFGAEFPEQREAALKALLSATFARTASTSNQTGIEGAALLARTTADVLSGALYADGAVGGVVMVRLKEVALNLGGGPQPLVFNLNAAMPWQLEGVPGFTKEIVDRLIAKLEKQPITKLDELAGTIPADSYAALEAGSK